MRGQRIGSTIAAVFGLLFVLLNTGALPAAMAWTLRALAVIAFIAVVVIIARGARACSLANRASAGPAAADAASADPVSADPAADHGARTFGLAYWLVVAVEVVALFGGVRLLSGPLGHPDGGVAWVSFVVGVHFFALAAVFRAPFFNWLGAAVTVCGVVGLILVFAGAGQGWIDVIGGVIPGALLLGFGGWGALSADHSLRSGAPTPTPSPAG